MKLCFISGPYLPGRCGISDYIGLLSHKFNHLGHEVEHLAIERKTGLSKLKKDLPIADFYSLQFAPYAFSTKGIGGEFLLELARILKGKKLQINFHEIWIGAYPQAPWQEKFIGWMQRKAILKFVKIANPMAVTCSNAAVLERLKQAGVHGNYLYLFGNIPYCQHEKFNKFENLRIAIFGTPYENFPYEKLAKKLFAISQQLKKQVQVRLIGRRRDVKGLHKIQIISQTHGFKVSEVGELSSQKISFELQNCDLGICTTPYDILGKSGATAALLEHGLPVIAFDDGDTPCEELFVFEKFEDQIFLLNDSSMMMKLISFLQKRRKPFFDGVAHTAKEMLKFLN